MTKLIVTTVVLWTVVLGIVLTVAFRADKKLCAKRAEQYGLTYKYTSNQVCMVLTGQGWEPLAW
jgi:hypothetical protein